MDKNQSIAIVGVGGIFPGAADLNEYWENILSARDCSREPPAGRWSLPLEDVYAVNGSQADRIYSKRACFVEDFQLDTQGLSIEDKFLNSLDPMFHLLLHAGNQAWRDAVTANLDKRRVGIIIGNIALPTDASSAIADEIVLPVFEKQILGKQTTTATTNLLNRYVAGLPAGTLARALGLGGGSYTLDAACASSLYALKYAVDELQAGRSDAMLCGGLSRPDSLYTQMGFSALHAISASGHCSPFDRKGDGLVVGEGAGILVLKRLHDAIADGDRIYATIAGVGLSNDIHGNLMSPDSEGQLRAMRDAYQQANWQVTDVDLIECHGTGTPVGDVVEFNSLSALWGDKRNVEDCVIGSVKSNIGHLLTAAGSAGLIKVLLAMQHKKLPPTANYAATSNDIDIAGSPFTVLNTANQWQRRNSSTPRRAAISAFGFGGINAHVLLEEWDERLSSAKLKIQNSNVRQKLQTCDIAIVGMDACFGPWQSLPAFQQRVLGAGEEIAPRRLENNWGIQSKVQAYAIDKVEIPVGRFRIPPNELKDMLPQQLLMLQVAANAIADAGIGEEKPAVLKDAGVYIGIGLDLNTTNFHLRWCLLLKARQWAKQLGLELTETQLQAWVNALREAFGPAMNANRTMGALGGIVASRIARAFDIGGPSLTLSAEESSGLRSLEAGVRALQRGEINTAIVGAVDLASDIRAVIAQQVRTDVENSNDIVIGDGAAAVILKRYDEAVRDGDRIYAVIKGLGAASGGESTATMPTVSTYEQAVLRCRLDAGVELDCISLVEIHGSAMTDEARMEARVIAHLFENRNAAMPCAIASVKADIGHCGAAGALASLVKTSLCLHHQVSPQLRKRNGFHASIDNNATLYAPVESHYWLRDRDKGPRRALVNSFSVDGNCISAIVEAMDESVDTSRKAPVEDLEALFSICADEKHTLVDSLQRLRAQASELRDRNINDVARRWWKLEAKNQQGKLAVSVIASDVSQLLSLLNQAQDHVETETSISTDRLFYAAQPMADTGKVAFVFPGSGSHFIGMGREMSARWPRVLNHLDEENQALASQFASSRFWTRKSTSNFSHEDYIFGQVWLGAMVSDVIASFAIKPDAVIGYCLGETAGLFATRSWNDRDLMLKRMRETRLFTHDLGGPCDAARKCWGVDSDEIIDWQLGVIDRTADEVRLALAGRQRVYLLIINTPDECIIGGDRAAVQGLVKHLKCGFHPLEGVTTVHCEVVEPVQQAYRELHLFDTKAPVGVDFYSGIAGSRYQVTTDSAADSIVRQALQTFDYTNLINAAYADGVRIFLEMGPGASCSRMIGQILGERQHIARSACVKGQSDVANVLRMLAQLNAERIPLDLSSLYESDGVADAYAEYNKIAVSVGKKAFTLPVAEQYMLRQGEKKLKEDEKIAELINCKPAPGQKHPMSQIVEQMLAVETANAETQEVFLQVANGINATLSQAISTQIQLLQSVPESFSSHALVDLEHKASDGKVAYDRNMCMEFAVGSIGKMLGPQFAEIDSYPVRVRLPDEPLMLVDRIIEVEGEACSMSRGRVVTEHDVHAGAWYLDAGRIPTCIAVEAGQADLFLSGYLGIDLHTHGLAVYRLLDAEVCFHSPLPHAGQSIHYDIRIDEFFRQGTTWLFRFHFDGTVDGQAFITMRNGCAGFFTQAELDAGRGVVRSSLETRRLAGKRADDWQNPVAMIQESYDDQQINALRAGDLAGCFAGDFAALALNNPVGLPGGKMTLVHRILSLDPAGGRFGLGMIIGEADIHADDWFLCCHFVDDQVMPGTLMYECCLHTLRVYLLRMGWVGEVGEFVYEPVIGVTSKLKCRGQVLASTSKVQYEISLKEIGYSNEDKTPYVIADALMYGDGKAIVQMSNMSLQLSGLGKAGIEAVWARTRSRAEQVVVNQPQALFDYASIHAFAVGKPSDAFGQRYRVFDKERVIARLPGPPFQFLDRIISIKDGQAWRLQAGAVIEGQYDVPPDAWYFAADRQRNMPFSVLLEIALQPCGWLAAYLGSALTSDVDMSFRNLGGKATQLLSVGPDSGTLTSKIKITNVALSGGMIIQNYDFEVRSEQGVVYVGDTYFGFFSKEALRDQVGIRDVVPYAPTQIEQARALQFGYPDYAPFPDEQMRMVHHIDCFDAEGGPQGLGFIRGTAEVNVDAWFFKAHFYQDPVWPGSLGLESFLQLLKVVAQRRWGGDNTTCNDRFQCMALGQQHSWLYRGQILPGDKRVTVQALITSINDAEKLLLADGFLSVDGRIIYQMNDFALRMTTS